MTNATVGSIVANICGGEELEDPALDDSVDAPEDGRGGFPNRNSVRRGGDVGGGCLNEVGSLMGAPCGNKRNPLVASPLCSVDGARMTSSC